MYVTSAKSINNDISFFHMHLNNLSTFEDEL